MASRSQQRSHYSKKERRRSRFYEGGVIRHEPPLVNRVTQWYGHRESGEPFQWEENAGVLQDGSRVTVYATRHDSSEYTEHFDDLLSDMGSGAHQSVETENVDALTKFHRLINLAGNERDKKVLLHRYCTDGGSPLTYSAIAEKLNLSFDQVRGSLAHGLYMIKAQLLDRIGKLVDRPWNDGSRVSETIWGIYIVVNRFRYRKQVGYAAYVFGRHVATYRPE